MKRKEGWMESMKRHFGYPDMPEGSCYIRTMDLVVIDYRESGILSVENGIRRGDQPIMDLFGRQGPLVFVDVSRREVNGVDWFHFSVIEFMDETAKKLFLMRHYVHEGNFEGQSYAYGLEALN